MLLLIEHRRTGSTRVRTWSSGRRWPQRHATWMLVCITCPENAWHRDARWGAGELAEAAVHFTLTRTMYPSIGADHEHPFMDTRFPDSSSFGSIMRSAPQQQWLRNGWMSTTIMLRCWLGLKSSDLSLSKRAVLDKHFWSVQLAGLKKHLQITSCCQILQHTSMARDYFGTKGRSTGRCVYT